MSYFEPAWRQTRAWDPVRCEVCKEFHRKVWLYFSMPSTWTHCVCVKCAKEI